MYAVDSETVTSLLYFLRLNGSVVDASTVERPSDAVLRRSVLDVVAGGQYRLYTGRRVVRLDQAYRLILVGRVDSEDVDRVLRVATTSWKTLLGRTTALYCFWYFN